MARIHELLRQLRLTNVALADDIEREVDVLGARRAFGLNFERHTPEAVELPGRPVRTGDKVHVLPPRGETPKAENDKLWRVVSISGKGYDRVAELEPHPRVEPVESATVPTADLVVVAEFRDPIYPGLVSTGKVERGGDKPFHTVINGENYHALQTLLFTHRAKVDAIYIDPPYNTRDNDWKYNNDYVNDDDLYKHSKWLAFMERRLLLAKELLNPEDSILVVTIDEKEFLRLGLLIEQTFRNARVQLISSVINPKGVSRGKGFRRTDEYIFVAMLGDASPRRLQLGPAWSSSANAAEDDFADSGGPLETPEWTSMMRRGSNSSRIDRPSMFYPIYVDASIPKVVGAGEALAEGVHSAPTRAGLVAVLPIRSNGDEGRWQVGAAEFASRLEQGRIRPGRPTAYGYVINYLPDGAYAAALSDQFEVSGRAEDGSLIALGRLDSTRVAPTQWKIASHNASEHGSSLLSSFIPRRNFPFPKSLYAVEDVLRFFVVDNPSAVVLDFFAGSGTTTHAVMRLNRQDGGRRTSISVTNNEVSPSEQASLRLRGLRPGDDDWEQWGICEYVTKPRIAAATTGLTPEGDAIGGEYKFADTFPIADGFNENVEFLTLSYEAPLRVRAHRDFEMIAPLLWLRAGSRGRRIEEVPNGWDVAEAYGVIADLDTTDEFLQTLATMPSATLAFVITDDNGLFESIVAGVPAGVEPVRLYEAYFRNFEIDAMRGVR